MRHSSVEEEKTENLRFRREKRRLQKKTDISEKANIQEGKPEERKKEEWRRLQLFATPVSPSPIGDSKLKKGKAEKAKRTPKAKRMV